MPNLINVSTVVDKETAKQQIKELVEKYDRVVEEKRVSKYGEENTKKDFITPLFRALGWDVENRNTPDEVTNEDRVSKGHVDYAFRLNGIPKFFLEAKALKEDLNNPKFIEQAITYAWTKGCTWAVLSDFESVMVFNAEWKTEDLLQNLFIEIPCAKFLDKFKELWLLSRESFEQGLINKEAEDRCKKAKLAPIDQYLLDDFARWRNALSKNILKYNSDKKLTEDELDETVQRLLNRLVFIRKAEDAELEEKVLEPALREWESGGGKALYVHLKEIFKKFRAVYDSELFDEALVDQVVITNDVLKEVITGLYKPANKLRRYNFAWIDADVLGNVYEQYLGHILKKTKKRADVKESHARRKKEGIYYTPTYIVDYIVRNTLGELLKDKKVDAEKIRVLDPACGSGSFLIKAFDVLNEHYSKHDKNYAQTQLDTTGQGTTFTKKVEILQKNIFGVDLDKQAVEIARLNLLLKIAEKGERLPLLKQNIQCGNSLIDDEKFAGDNAFKWEQKFEGGFDVVIGNPPYGAEFSLDEKTFIKSRFKSATGRYDSYYYFIERSIELLTDGGFLGFIVPDTWLTNHQTQNLRDIILSTCSIVRIVGLPQNVFVEANVDTCILILVKESDNGKRERNKIIVNVMSKDATLHDLSRENFERTFEVQQKVWANDTRKVFNIYVADNTLIEKIKSDCDKLRNITEMCRGINPYDKYAGQTRETIEKRIYHSLKKLGPEYKKELVGSDIGRYKIDVKSKLWVKYGSWLAAPRDPKFFTLPHLVVQRIRNPKLKIRLVATFIDPKDEYYNNSGLTNIIITNLQYSIKYVLAIITSKLLNWYYRQHFRDVNIKPEDMRELPIRNISEKEQNPFINLVDKMLSLNKRLGEIGDKKTDQSHKIEEDIKKTDAEIDELVYKLYGINEEEKKIIEESLK